MVNEEEAEEEEAENFLIDAEVEVQTDFQTADLRQDLKKETIVEVHLVKKEMIKEDLSATEEVTVDHHKDLKNEMTVEAHLVKKEMIEKDLLATEEAIVEQPQDLKEMRTEAHTVKKVVNPLSSRRNLEVSKRNLSKNQPRNPLINLNNFCH